MSSFHLILAPTTIYILFFLLFLLFFFMTASPSLSSLASLSDDFFITSQLELSFVAFGFIRIRLFSLPFALIIISTFVV
jgi:hypothetical protein